MKKLQIIIYVLLMSSIRLQAQYRAPLCPDGNHPHAIDLGLPSGKKWACCNVGAYRPSDYGSYYAWGEVQQKGTYNYTTYKYKSNTLDTNADAAHVYMQGSWQMPTFLDFNELYTKTEVSKITVNGVKGVRFKSKTNGNSIFLPFAGIYKESDLERKGEEGCYWSSSPDMHYPDVSANYLLLGTDRVNTYQASREYGLSVRAVTN